MSNDKMDVWEVDVESVAANSTASSAQIAVASRARAGGSPFEGCSHAKKAAERRQKAAIEQFLSKERESGTCTSVHMCASCLLSLLCEGHVYVVVFVGMISSRVLCGHYGARDSLG